MPAITPTPRRRASRMIDGSGLKAGRSAVSPSSRASAPNALQQLAARGARGRAHHFPGDQPRTGTPSGRQDRRDRPARRAGRRRELRVASSASISIRLGGDDLPPGEEVDRRRAGRGRAAARPDRRVAGPRSRPGSSRADPRAAPRTTWQSCRSAKNPACAPAGVRPRLAHEAGECQREVVAGVEVHVGVRDHTGRRGNARARRRPSDQSVRTTRAGTPTATLCGGSAPGDDGAGADHAVLADARPGR